MYKIELGFLKRAMLNESHTDAAAGLGLVGTGCEAAEDGPFPCQCRVSDGFHQVAPELRETGPDRDRRAGCGRICRPRKVRQSVVMCVSWRPR